MYVALTLKKTTERSSNLYDNVTAFSVSRFFVFCPKLPEALTAPTGRMSFAATVIRSWAILR